MWEIVVNLAGLTIQQKSHIPHSTKSWDVTITELLHRGSTPSLSILACWTASRKENGGSRYGVI